MTTTLTKPKATRTPYVPVLEDFSFETLARVGLNPIRAQIMRLMVEHPDCPDHATCVDGPPMTTPPSGSRARSERIYGWSPNEIQRHFENRWSLGAIAYHVRTLVRDGWIKPTGERRVRGALEHFHQPLARRPIDRR